MNLNPAVIRRPGGGTITGISQLLLNHAPVSRGPWRLKALIDEQGHAIRGRFLAVRPRSNKTPPFYLWALLNSPFANGFIFAHSTKRDVLKKTIAGLPVPQASAADVAGVVESVRTYLDTVRDPQSVEAHNWNQEKARTLLLQVDASVLRLYALPPRLERKLLDLFRGYPRQGVPFIFEEYFPTDFEPTIPLYLYLSEEYKRSTAGALRSRHQAAFSPEILNALQRAREDFSE